MSYICKGDIPKNCSKCPQRTLYHGISVCLAADKMKVSTSNKSRHENCPLIELPAKHGRLIDADYINGSGLIGWQKSIVKAEISQAPTVIEAEELNENS